MRATMTMSVRERWRGTLIRYWASGAVTMRPDNLNRPGGSTLLEGRIRQARMRGGVIGATVKIRRCNEITCTYIIQRPRRFRRKYCRFVVARPRTAVDGRWNARVENGHIYTIEPLRPGWRLQPRWRCIDCKTRPCGARTSVPPFVAWRGGVQAGPSSGKSITVTYSVRAVYRSRWDTRRIGNVKIELLQCRSQGASAPCRPPNIRFYGTRNTNSQVAAVFRRLPVGRYIIRLGRQKRAEIRRQRRAWNRWERTRPVNTRGYYPYLLVHVPVAKVVCLEGGQTGVKVDLRHQYGNITVRFVMELLHERRPCPRPAPQQLPRRR